MKNVLIIDKEKSIRKALSLFLSRQGYVAVTAESVAEAQALMENESFDAVIADVPLNDSEAVKFYGRANNSQDVNYIFTSAFPETAPLNRGFNIKEAAFLEKPFTLSRLTELLTPRYGKDMAIAV